MLAQTVPTARKLLFRTNLFMINGVWGFAPCQPGPLPLRARILEMREPLCPHYPSYNMISGVWGSAPCLPEPLTLCTQMPESRKPFFPRYPIYISK